MSSETTPAQCRAAAPACVKLYVCECGLVSQGPRSHLAPGEPSGGRRCELVCEREDFVPASVVAARDEDIAALDACYEALAVGRDAEAEINNQLREREAALTEEIEQLRADNARLSARVKADRQESVRAGAAYRAATETLRAQYRAAVGYGDVERVAELKLAEGARQERKRLEAYLSHHEDCPMFPAGSVLSTGEFHCVCGLVAGIPIRKPDPDTEATTR